MLLRMLSDILLVLIICKHQAHHYLHRYRISVFLLVALTIIAEGVVAEGGDCGGRPAVLFRLGFNWMLYVIAENISPSVLAPQVAYPGAAWQVL